MKHKLIHEPSKWDLRFFALAKEVSTWSKDPSTKTGAVIINEEKIVISTGYNGFPRGMYDGPELYENRNIKYTRILHADLNAILSAKQNVTGYTIYTYPFFTCATCALAIIQAGIKTVISPEFQDAGLQKRWNQSTELAKTFYRESGIDFKLMEISYARLEEVS
jgi:dCMP deaminase